MISGLKKLENEINLTFKGLHSRFELEKLHSELETCLNITLNTQLNVYLRLKKKGKENNFRV